METRYCQRCAQAQMVGENSSPRPCVNCGGTNFAATPKPHNTMAYDLTPWDRDFLKVQRIKEEN